MDRKTAKQFIGKYVILDEGNEGQYIALLEDVIMEPKKPWRALLRIKGVYVYPDLNFENLELVKPKLGENDLFECSGHRVEPLREEYTRSYNDSVTFSLKQKWDEIQQINQDSELLLSLIQQELRRLHAEYLIFEDGYIYYQLVKKGRKVHIYNEEKRETLPIDGCPFEFEIKVDEKWSKALYQSGFTFKLSSNREVELSKGETVRLNKSQFDPYRILINELEVPSLHALEKGLQKLGIGHEHSVYCHNSLLIQLLHSFSKDQLTGVNFISYANSKNQFVVQHYYERKMIDDGEDVMYDRFEFTSDTGERVLTTYANQFSSE
ncbi:DUF2777 family protein [Evansella sp. AB-P1]|uniref:DUF2777 family protein n=1 Tax=Evansella sp. AB-P1 TaxID=3037653 RepID=UPI00241F6137|nr:DUF2777 family protein [Evansella sp. AB-P1]MDG5787537.1 DUF2777 family protein [Evansella sp. AB-P1]